MELFNIAYILLNGFWCYNLYLFISVFFDIPKTGKAIHILSYVIYHICSLMVYFFIGNVFVFSCFNLISCFFLTFNYSSKMSRRILATAIIFATTTMIEFAVAMACGYFKLSTFENYSIDILYQEIIIQLIVSRLSLFMTALILRNFKGIKHGIKIPPYHWTSIILLPIFSLYVGVLLFNTNLICKATLTIGIAGILLINFSVFYLYDAIIKAQEQKVYQALLLEQNKSYEKQFSIIKESVINAGRIRHDFKHHLAAISGMVQSKNEGDCLEYIARLMDTEIRNSNISNSGNIIVDSILKFKLATAVNDGIIINLSINISDDIVVSPSDMTLILGNLLDNAVEATCNLTQDSKIDVTIRETKGRFIIKVSNTCADEIKIKDNKIATTKQEKVNHGLGIESIKTTLEKYNGELSLEYKDNLFTAIVLFYL